MCALFCHPCSRDNRANFNPAPGSLMLFGPSGRLRLLMILNLDGGSARYFCSWPEMRRETASSDDWLRTTEMPFAAAAFWTS
jgi:hypothetical protein